MKTIGLLLSMVLISTFTYPLTQQARELGFVYLHEVAPTIQISLRYAGNENFVGTPVDGYHNAEHVILTKQTAQALQKVQEAVQKDGYCLVVYDAYRPQQAVDHFWRWAHQITDQQKKADYYPRVNKADVFDLGYVAKKSGHSRGSTVDLTLIPLGKKVHPVVVSQRTLCDGTTINFLDDGTIDMGSSFDLFDVASHHENDLISEEHKKLRTYLKNVMATHGFKTITEEWWHYTLKNEPYPANQENSYFNFDVE